jgi:hypothetical protein
MFFTNDDYDDDDLTFIGGASSKSLRSSLSKIKALIPVVIDVSYYKDYYSKIKW